MQTWKFLLIHLLLFYSIAKIFNIAYNFYGTDLYVEAYVEPSRTSTVELLCKNHERALLYKNAVK